MKGHEVNLKWSVRRRLEHIDLLLAWDGYFGRQQLTDFFDISEPQASADIKLYQEKAVGNIIYNMNKKRYEPSTEFEPYFLNISSQRHLNSLYLRESGVIDDSLFPYSFRPPVEILTVARSAPSSDLLFAIIRAIRTKKYFSANYQSMTREELSRRNLAPHAIFWSNNNWYIRAHCLLRQDYINLSIPRIRTFEFSDENAPDQNDDKKWNQKIRVNIRPHSLLSEAQQKAVALEFGMRGAKKVFEVRKCLLFFFVNSQNLNPTKYSDKPKEALIEIENWSDVETYYQ